MAAIIGLHEILQNVHISSGPVKSLHDRSLYVFISLVDRGILATAYIYEVYHVRVSVAVAVLVVVTVVVTMTRATSAALVVALLVVEQSVRVDLRGVPCSRFGRFSSTSGGNGGGDDDEGDFCRFACCGTIGPHQL